jgi:tetratricopeptide (TPR) repeat protein
VREEKWAEARGAFEEARRLAPGDPDAYYELARVYRRLGDEKAAAQALARHHDLVLFRARKDVLEAKIAEAGGDAAKAAPLRLELARGLAARQMYGEASEQYERLLVESPGRTDIRKEYDVARRRALPAEALLQEADALLAQGRPEAAASLYLTVAERDRRNAAAWEGAGISLSTAGDLTRAVPCLLHAADLGPSRPRAQMALAQVYHQAGLSQAARQCLERVVKAEPSNAAAWHDLGVVLNEGAHTKEQGEKALRQAVTLDGKNTGYLLELADALAAKDKASEAEATFRRALSLEPKSGEVLSRFGGFLAQRSAGVPDRQAEGERLLREALAIDPKDDFARYNLGRIAYDRGDYKQAVALLEPVLANPDNADAPDVWYILARARRRTGDAAGAAKAEANADRLQKDFIAFQAARERAAQRPSDAAAQRDVARLYAARGQDTQALILYDRSLRLNPKDAAARSERDALGQRLQTDGKLPTTETYRTLLDAASASAPASKSSL